MKLVEPPFPHGIVPPIVTPLLEDLSIDRTSVDRLVEHLIDGGVHGIFVLGSTGEAPSLSYSARHELIEAIASATDGRVPLLVGITDTSLVESTSLAKLAADCGAAAVVTSAPFYFRITQNELSRYVEQLADASPLPVVLYNIPQLTNTVFEVATVRRLLDHRNVIGVKDSSGDMKYFCELANAVEEFADASLMMGPEEMLAQALRMGGHGGICGGANLFPKLHVELYEAHQQADVARVAKLHQDVMTVSNALYNIGNRGSSFVSGIKMALSRCGITGATVAPPFQSFDAEEVRTLDACLDTLQQLDNHGIQSVLAKPAAVTYPNHA